ncbi:MAG TPA: polyphosphate:AMP phosphotransferase [Opitutaceae bacterium]|jgi:polyphosphate:AMP phosphotransferase|nr:polyphosphate:AMP phosphotransferase [Opitutaceae bacterium]
MAKSADDRRVSRKAYEARLPDVRAALVRMQVELKSAKFPVILVIGGVEASGKGEVINILNGWLDPRGFETFAFHEPTDEERERPAMWRYWRTLPPAGRMAIYAGGWHADALHEDPRSARELAQFDAMMRRYAGFEGQLAAGGALIIKLWLNLSKSQQRARLRVLESDPRTAWRVTPEDWKSQRDYDRIARLTERMRAATHQPGAPWYVIDSSDPRARNLAVADILLSRFRIHVRAQARLLAQNKRAKRIVPLRPAGLKRLLSVPLDSKLSQPSYEKKRDKWLGRLNKVVRAAAQERRSIVWVFEGWDAAGKGGAIRRLTDAIDARDFRVIPVSKPTDEEKSHHYLWRFWRHVPRAGMVTIYDRSWYGRVLVERLEGFATEAEWKRAYKELNEFERELTEHGVIVLKFWLQIGKAEQLKRFRDRESTAYKKHKMDTEDWRNRRKWSSYEIAVGDMLALTSTRPAPWQLIAANNKRHARLEILKTSCRQIEAALGL